MGKYYIGKLETKLNNFFIDVQKVDNFEDRESLFKYSMSFMKMSFSIALATEIPIMFGWSIDDHVIRIVFTLYFIVLMYVATSGAITIIGFDLKYRFFKKRLYPILFCVFWFLFAIAFGIVLPLLGYHVGHIAIEEDVELVTRYSFLGPIPITTFLVFLFFEKYSFSRRMSIRASELYMKEKGIPDKDPFNNKKLERPLRSQNATFIFIIVVVVFILAFCHA